MVPSVHDLTYFVEIAATLNLSRAAERLGVSQPSLSLAIQRIEASVGTPVLTRNKRGVTMTQAGKQLLTHSKLLLQTWDQVRAQTLASVHEIQGSYTLGCHPSVALFSLSGFLGDLLERYPKLDIKLKHDLSRKVTEGVISCSIDIGIVVNPVRHPDLVIHKLCDDEVTFWRGEGSRKAQDIGSGEAVLFCDPDLIQSQALLKKMKDSKIQVAKTIESNSLEVIADLTASGCGIGILPSRVAALSKTKKLRRIPKTPTFHDEICVLYRVENRGVKSIQKINDVIKSFFEAS